MWRGALIGAALWTAGCDGSEKRCTLIGCSDQLNVTLQSARPFEAGDYSIRVNSGGVSAECTLNVMAATEELPQCDDGAHHARWELCESLANGTLGCRKLRLLFSWRERPVGAVDVSVTRDEETLLERSAQSSCEAFRPNGPGCAPVCTGCDVSLSLP
jgi:hypothetical protein